MVVSKMVHRGQINWVIWRVLFFCGTEIASFPKTYLAIFRISVIGGGGAFTIIFSLLDNYSSITFNQLQLTGLSLRPAASNLENNFSSFTGN